MDYNYNKYNNSREYKLLDNYMSSYYIDNDDDFFDICLNKIGKGLKYIGSKSLEYIKKKYMVGKYSRNYKKRINDYKQGKIIYKECVNLYSLILTDNIINKEVTNKYVTLCNKLNKICYNFREELPYLDCRKPNNAITNFEEVENYVNMLLARTKQPKLLNQ